MYLAPTDAGWQSFLNTAPCKAIFGTSLDNVINEDALLDLLRYHVVSYIGILNAGDPSPPPSYILTSTLLDWTLGGAAPIKPDTSLFYFFQSGVNYSTLRGASTVSYTRYPGNDTAYVNDARTLHANIPMPNGVMYLIDGPLHFNSVPQITGTASPVVSASATPMNSLTTPSSPATRSSGAVAPTTTIKAEGAHASTAVVWAVVSAGAGAVALLV